MKPSTARNRKPEHDEECPKRDSCPHAQDRVWTVWLLREVVVPFLPTISLFLFYATRLGGGRKNFAAISLDVASGPELPFFSMVILASVAIQAISAYRMLPGSAKYSRNFLVAASAVAFAFVVVEGFYLIGYYDLIKRYEKGARAAVEWIGKGLYGPPPDVVAYPEEALSDWTSMQINMAILALITAISTDWALYFVKKKYPSVR